MRIFFINNSGGGFCDHVEVEPGTSVQQLFTREIKQGQPSDYFIRVNRQPVPSNQMLQEGDRVTITPLKIEGATH